MGFHMKAFRWFIPACVVLALVLSGCSKDETPTAPAGGATTYIGVLGNGAEAGSITLTFSAAPKVAPGVAEGTATIITVTGTVKFVGGATIILTGTYNTDNDSLIVSGGGYTFKGTYTNGVISGTYTGPNGAGS